MRPSSLALLILAIGIVGLTASFADAARLSAERSWALGVRAGLVAELGLTDLALFTEARYTRHPSQADRHAAFQDHPMAFEHFPTGSLVTPSFLALRR